MRRKRRKYQSSEIEESIPYVLQGYEENKKSLLHVKDYNGLEILLQDLFVDIRNRIKQENFSQKLDEIILKSSILFEDLKREKEIDSKTFKILDLLPTINRLEIIGDNLDRELDYLPESDELDKKEDELDRIERTNSFLIRLFNNYARQYPSEIEVPENEVLDFLLSIENDWDFEILLTGFAQTGNERVKAKLKEFEEDEEYKVVQLAKTLLNKFEYEEEKISISKKSTWNELISKDKIEEALRQILDFANSTHDKELIIETYNQLGRVAMLNKEIRNGLLDTDDRMCVKNQIRFGILEMINRKEDAR